MGKTKKILFILHSPPPVHGSSVIGAQIINSKVLNETFDCTFINLGTSRSIEDIGKKRIGKIFLYFQIIYQVVKSILTNRPDLCYLAITVKGLAFLKDSLLVLVIKMFRIQLIYHLHNKGVNTYQERKVYNSLYSFVFNKSDVILLSRSLYQDIERYVPESRVYYCPNGIPDRSERSKNEAIKTDFDRINILFFSNLLTSKGVFVLLDACRILKCKKLKFHCTFAGGEGDINELQFRSMVIELNLTEYVSYIGKKYEKEKELVFCNADIFAFPTYFETFGLVLLEAMQHSLPIVSTLEGGIPDIIEDGISGFLVHPKNANEFADKLEVLILNEELRKNMGVKGRTRYEHLFTLNHFENNFNKIMINCMLKLPH